MPRTKGSLRYDNGALLSLIAIVKPASVLQWKDVGQRYKAVSGEATVRDYDSLKRYFIQTLCNNHKKPTGSSAPPPQVAQAQEIYQQILAKQGSASIGSGLDDSFDNLPDDEDSDSEDDDESDREDLHNNDNNIPTTTALPPASNNNDNNNGNKKRKAVEVFPTSEKSKNSRPSGRNSAAQNIDKLADAISSSSSNSGMMQLFSIMMQQQERRQEQMMLMMMQMLKKAKKDSPGLVLFQTAESAQTMCMDLVAIMIKACTLLTNQHRSFH